MLIATVQYLQKVLGGTGIVVKAIWTASISMVVIRPRSRTEYIGTVRSVHTYTRWNRLWWRSVHIHRAYDDNAHAITCSFWWRNNTDVLVVMIFYIASSQNKFRITEACEETAFCCLLCKCKPICNLYRAYMQCRPWGRRALGLAPRGPRAYGGKNWNGLLRKNIIDALSPYTEVKPTQLSGKLV